MSYQPRRQYSEAPRKTGRRVDGADTYAVAFYDPGAMATGNTRGGSLGFSGAPTSLIHTKGGATKADGVFLPCISNLTSLGTVTSAGQWLAVIDFVGSLYRIRSSVGGSFTTTNALSDGYIVCEYLP